MRICLAICLWGMVLQGSAQTQIAFISDAHIQDVDGHAERVRSMEAQVQSTRLFNENYYAYSMFLSKSFYEFNIFLTSVNLAL